MVFTYVNQSNLSIKQSAIHQSVIQRNTVMEGVGWVGLVFGLFPPIYPRTGSKRLGQPWVLQAVL